MDTEVSKLLRFPELAVGLKKLVLSAESPFFALCRSCDVLRNAACSPGSACTHMDTDTCSS